MAKSYRSPLKYLVDLSRPHPIVATVGMTAIAAVLGTTEGWRFSEHLHATVISAIAWAVVVGGSFGWLTWRSRRTRPAAVTVPTSSPSNVTVIATPVLPTAQSGSTTPQLAPMTSDVLPTAATAVTTNYWWTRFQQERSIRVIVGGALIIPALLLAFLHLKIPALVLFVPGGFIMSSARYKTF